jgi:hypothetical protein
LKQLLFEFVAEYIAATGIPLDPRVQEELVARMAEAILIVLEAEGGRNDEPERRAQS